MRHRILQIRDLSENVFLLRMERSGLDFVPGQYISVGREDARERRDYTIYSSPNEDYLELLIKDVHGGDVSGKLHNSHVGEKLEVSDPLGSFIIPDERQNKKLLFIATGTGIAPFHSFVTSYKSMNYQLLHGVRYPSELYGLDSYDSERHIACLTRSQQGDFNGRVTDFLKIYPIDNDTLCYLCGSSDMIYDCFEILQGKGIPREQLFTETYF